MVEGVGDPEVSFLIISGPVGAVELLEGFAGLGWCSRKEVDGFFLRLVEADSVVVVIADDDVSLRV